MKLRSLPLITGALVLCLTATVTRPVRAEPGAPAAHLVVPFATGTAPDVLGRLLAEQLATTLQRPIVVRNSPGAGGNIGVEQVARAVPDGRTVVLAGDAAITVSPALMADLPYSPQRDLAPITQVAITPNVLVVAPKHDLHTLQELARLARGRKKPLTYASAGAGTSSHRAGLLLARELGVEMTHVPYSNTSPLVDLVSGEIDLFFAPPATSIPLVRDQKLRAIAVTAGSRIAALPDVPTMIESGFPRFEVSAWFGLFAPAGTPPTMIERWQDATVRALESPAIRDRLVAMGATPVGNTPVEFARLITVETPRWQALLRPAERGSTGK